MEKIPQKLISKLFVLWKEQVREIKDTYGLEGLSAPSEIVLSDERTNIADHTPGIIRTGSVIINSKIREYEKLLPLTISKLCLQSSLPTDLLCESCIDDLSFEYARKSIENDSLRRDWEAIWCEHSPPRKISVSVEYNPCVGYNWLHSVSGGTGLDTFVKELTHRAKNQISLSFDDYMRYFQMRVRRFERTLDSTELKLINALIGNPSLSSKNLSKQVGITEEWASRKLSQLQKRMVLRKFSRAPFSRLGIKMSHFLISRITSDEDPFTYLKDCPFLYSYRRVVSGNWISLATLCIPDNIQSTELINAAIPLIERKGFAINNHEIKSSGTSRCFDYYTPTLGYWDIPWELLTIQLQRILVDDLASSIPRIDKQESRTNIELDELDMMIFECVQLGVSSVSKIRSHLKVGQHRVAEKLQKMRENGLVIKSWETHNIGLNEYAIIYCKDKEMGKTIAAWSLRLPQSIISFSSKEELMLVVDLPRGGSFGLATALEGLSNRTHIGILSSQIYGKWGFPSILWDEKHQNWKCPKNRLEKWLAQLE